MIDEIDALREILPALDIVIIDGADHAGERPTFAQKEFAEAVHNFITAHAGSSQN